MQRWGSPLRPTHEAEEGASLSSQARAYLERYGGRLLGGAPGADRASSSNAAAPEETARFRGEPEIVGGSYGTALLKAILPAALGGCNYGYDVGSFTAFVQNLQKHGPEWGRNLHGTNLGVLLCASSVGQVAGTTLTYNIGDRLAARELIGLGCLAQLAAGTLFLHAHDLYGVLLARMVFGFGSGFIGVGVPQYIAEVSPAEVRGTMVAFKETMIIVGVVIGALVGIRFVTAENGWHWLPAMGIIPIASMNLLGLATFSPESPRRLRKLGRQDEARDVLRYLRPQMAEHALEEELQSLPGPLDGQDATIGMIDMVRDPRLRRLVLTGWSISFSQSATAHPTYQLLATQTFHQLGLKSSTHAQMATTIFMLDKLVMASIAQVLTDKVGRRPMLLRGIAVLGASYITLGIAYLFPLGSTFRLYTGIAGMLVQGASYNLSLGPLTWVINSEIYPAPCRSSAMSMALLAGWVGQVVAALSVPILQESIGITQTYFLVTLVTAAAWVQCNVLVFESSGMTLEQIEQMRLEDMDSGWEEARGPPPLPPPSAPPPEDDDEWGASGSQR